MFNIEKYKKAVYELQILDTDLYADIEYEVIWRNLVDTICSSDISFNQFIDYLKDNGTSYDLTVLYSICDDILNRFPKKIW